MLRGYKGGLSVRLGRQCWLGRFGEFVLDVLSGLRNSAAEAFAGRWWTDLVRGERIARFLVACVGADSMLPKA